MRGISRRDVLKNLAVGAAGGSVLQMIPAEAAALVHQMVHKEKAGRRQGSTRRNIFQRTNTNPGDSLRCHHSQGRKVRRGRGSGRAGVH